MKNDITLSPLELDHLRTPEAIRERAGNIFGWCQRGSSHFSYQPENLRGTVDFVLKVLRRNYPDLKIPFHSRWGHFRAGGIDRVALWQKSLPPMDALERARSKLDLVITSVLLDAGAGPSWRYLEGDRVIERSEGLAVASLAMFQAGAMGGPGLADAEGLSRLTAANLRQHFQVTDANPLAGVEGRIGLLNRLATAVAGFPGARPGGIVDILIKRYGQRVPAVAILRQVLESFAGIWPGRVVVSGHNLGDVWLHSCLPAKLPADRLIPFHKLSQWMTYSLIEPIEEAGVTVVGVEGLTGLAEYRNGGLLIDMQLLNLREPKDLQRSWAPSSDLVIEWRALTVHLLDVIAREVRTELGLSPSDFPLAKVLEGGTWWAGRAIAAEKRSDGSPPLKIVSDGTVF